MREWEFWEFWEFWEKKNKSHKSYKSHKTYKTCKTYKNAPASDCRNSQRFSINSIHVKTQEFGIFNYSNLA